MANLSNMYHTDFEENQMKSFGKNGSEVYKDAQTYLLTAYIIGVCTVAMFWFLSPARIVVERIARAPAAIERDPQCYIIGSMREYGRSMQWEHMDCISRTGATNTMLLDQSKG